MAALNTKHIDKEGAGTLSQQTTSSFPELAVIGMAFRLPGDLADEQGLQAALKQGRDLITEVPADRWATGELQHDKRSEAGRSVTFSAGVLSRVDEFDAAFFGISPREAAWLDPQQRLLLELAWESMENAGVPPSSLSGTDCAVYVGISSLDYGTRALDDLASMSAHSMTGNTLSVAANRLSYVFDLHGPSLAVDTACSSSLVALHHACRALHSGEAGMALVGGVSLLLHPYPFIGFTKASMLSEDGRCKAFDADGKGYVRSEGGAVLLIKPLQQAIDDGDSIQAVIRATGVNADGARKTGITIPSRDGQAELMQATLAKTTLKPSDIDYVEAHGTGTMVGDPIETAAIGAVYGQGRSAPLPIGSIKANLGHLEAASGMAGLVKTILALKNRELPPQIHFDTPNENIDFAGLNLQPVTRHVTLDKDAPLVAGVNSFGFGGANGHVLLQEYPQPAQAVAGELPAVLPPLILSARCDAALQAMAQRYAQLLQGKTDAEYYAIAHAAAFRRDRLDKRLQVSGDSVDEIVSQLEACARGEQPDAGVWLETAPDTGEIAFVYSGNGAQWQGMAQQLLEQSAEFAARLEQLDAKMQPLTGFSLLDELRADEASSRLDDTIVAQPLLFALQVALTEHLRELGVQPAAVTGHSVGEVAAAWACGALDLDAAIRVIVARSAAQGTTRGSGRMAVAALDVESMQAMLQQLAEEQGGELDVAIAGINSANNLTLSGSLADLEQVGERAAREGVFFRLLELDYAFHSPHMDPIRPLVLDSLQGLETSNDHACRYVSTVTGQPLAGDELNADYWWRNVREPVLFEQVVDALHAQGCRIFIEIGPHAILQRYLGECLNVHDSKSLVLPTLRKNSDDSQQLAETIGRARLALPAEALRGLFPSPARPARLPNYPWQRERHWHPVSSESLHSFSRQRVHPLLGWKLTGADYSWENTLDPLQLPWLADHRVGGAVVFPGAGYAEMALAAAHQWLGGEHLALEEMDILSPVVFDGEHARTLRLELNSRDGSFQIKSRQRLSEDEWTLHVAGRILQPAGQPQARLEAPVAPVNCIDQSTHYRLADALGLNYGPLFRGLRQASCNGEQLEGELQWPDGLEGTGYHLHPALLDVCYQSLVDFYQNEIEAGSGVALLPVKTGQLELCGSGQPQRFRVQIRRKSARSVLADFELYNADGCLLAVATGCRFRAAPLLQRDAQGISHWNVQRRLQPHPAESGAGIRFSAADLLSRLQTNAAAAESDEQARRLAWLEEGMPLFELLVVTFAYEACLQLAEDTPEDWQHLLQSDDAYTGWLLDLLRSEGLLTRTDNGDWTLSRDSDLPAAEQIWLSLEQEHTAALPQLVLLGRVGRALPMLLRAPQHRAELLESLLRSASAEILYQADPAYAAVHQALETSLETLAASLQPGRRLRVLEISAGASELPRSLLEVLEEDRLDYVLAGPASLAERQQAEYARFHNLTVATLDEASWQLHSEKTLPARYDVIILGHRLHAASNPHLALQNCHQWLADDGCLLLAERNADWSADLLAGLDQPWWRVVENGQPAQSSLLPPQAWQAALADSGFAEIELYREGAVAEQATGAYLLLARRPQTGVVEEPAASITRRRWLLWHDAASQSCARALEQALQEQGQQVQSLSGAEPDLYSDEVQLVYMRGWHETAAQAGERLGELLQATQQLAAVDASRLWLIAKGGALVTPAPEGEPVKPLQSALWGYGRVVMNELPALHCTLIDDRITADEAIRTGLLLRELLQPDGCEEIILENNRRYSLVLCAEQDPGVAAAVQTTSEKAQRASVAAKPNTAALSTTEQKEADDNRFRLDFLLPGKLTNLLWLPQPEQPLAAEEAEVAVQATGLNFRDVMYLMGLLPDEAVEKGFAGASLGLEMSGIVRRVGSAVSHLKPGDRVMGFGSACFSSHVVTRADALAPIPQGWSFDAAATVPTVFLTVYYALKQLADLQPGERVLIHGAAGGVGIAAIQLAKHLGAEVFATAGSDDKRDFVHLLGADHVFDSRSLNFARDIQAVTDGEGVDVILNSLAGEAIRRNLSVLKPFGRFLELGKRDFFENTPIGLRPFKDNISYFGIDADQLLTGRPQLAARLFNEVMQLFVSGALTPLPCRSFPASRVVDAFRVMQQARHIGKIVVSMHNARPALQTPLSKAAPLQLQAGSTWLVTGGLSGFGLESARWLAQQGADNLVLIGRRGADTPGAAQALAELKAAGIHARAEACDITDAAAVKTLLQQVQQQCPPIKGILHAAAVFDDALLQNLDAERMQAVLAPKLLGGWNLHQASTELALPLEHFVVYSSITSAIGNPGQANYVAANSGLEGLIALRRQQGLPGSFVGWGPIADAGYLTRNEAVRDSLGQRLGKAPLLAGEALEQLSGLLPAQASRVVGNFDWNSLSRVLPSAGGQRFLILNRSLKSSGMSSEDVSLEQLLAGKTPDEAAALVRQLVAGEVAQILAVNAERIDHEHVLHDLGLDSLMAVELALGLEQRFGIQLPVMMLNESPTVAKVSAYLLDKLQSDAPQAEPSSALDNLVEGMARQHGESISSDTLEHIANEVRSLGERPSKPAAEAPEA